MIHSVAAPPPPLVLINEPRELRFSERKCKQLRQEKKKNASYVGRIRLYIKQGKVMRKSYQDGRDVLVSCFFPFPFLEGGTNAMSFYRKLYRGLETFSCGILMLLSSLSLPRNLPEFFRDLLILTKFCQTRSIGSPDAFFQFPLKCFQQRLPFLASDIKECTFHQILPFSLKLNHGIYLRLLKNILDFNK